MENYSDQPNQVEEELTHAEKARGFKRMFAFGAVSYVISIVLMFILLEAIEIDPAALVGSDGETNTELSHTVPALFIASFPYWLVAFPLSAGALTIKRKSVLGSGVFVFASFGVIFGLLMTLGAFQDTVVSGLLVLSLLALGLMNGALSWRYRSAIFAGRETSPQDRTTF